MSAPLTIHLLADQPDLAAGWAELHWREWGDEPGRDQLAWWVADAVKAVSRVGPPAAFVALSADGYVLGGVGLHQFDLDERRDRSPWIVGMIVRGDRRGEGIGQALIAHLELWAMAVGIAQVWVCTETGSRAVPFYRRCGYAQVEELLSPTRGPITVLTKRLSVG